MILQLSPLTLTKREEIGDSSSQQRRFWKVQSYHQYSLPGQPKYLSVTKPNERSENTTTTARHAKEEEHLKHLEAEMLRRDSVSNINDLENLSTLPSGFDIILKDSKLICIHMNEDYSCVHTSVVIIQDLTISISWAKSITLQSTTFPLWWSC